ncbi:MAG: hypothetical protein ACLRXQ_08050 [Phascolarctobacterium faecium]
MMYRLLLADIVAPAGGLTAAEILIAAGIILFAAAAWSVTSNAVYLEQYCGAQVAGSPQEVKRWSADMRMSTPSTLASEAAAQLEIW